MRPSEEVREELQKIELQLNLAEAQRELHAHPAWIRYLDRLQGMFSEALASLMTCGADKLQSKQERAGTIQELMTVRGLSPAAVAQLESRRQDLRAQLKVLQDRGLDPATAGPER